MKNYTIRIPDVEINKDDVTESKFLGTYKDLDSGIPKILVDKIQDSLTELGSGLEVTPTMFDPKTIDIIFGILETNKEGITLKYNITISKQKQN